jgi:serine/threonine protein kinase
VETNRLLEDQKIREKLFNVISEFPVIYQARQGKGTKILNPFSSLERVVREHVNPLSLFLNDLVEQVKTGMTYFEALDLAVNFAMKHKFRDRIIEAVKELAKIESKRHYFLNGLAHYLDDEGIEKRAERLRLCQKKMRDLNQRYMKVYGRGSSIDIIPWRIAFREGKEGATEGTYEYPASHQLDVFRRAFLAFTDILDRRESKKWFSRISKKEITAEISALADLLFDYGYSVKEICGSLTQEKHSPVPFLNNRLLSNLEKDASKIKDVKEASRQIRLMALLDYHSMIPFRTLYCKLSDRKTVETNAKEIEKQLRIKNCDFKRIARLFNTYRENKRTLLAYYLDFKFSRSFGDYYKPKGEDGFGTELTQRFVLKYYNPEDLDKRVNQEIIGYSSKGTQEMIELLNLFIRSLSHPEKLQGKRIHVLGMIQSGAMGKVRVGILDGGIVALKEPKEATGESSSKLTQLLEYEGAIHSHVQSEKTQHENIVECFGMVEAEARQMLALGYHPANNIMSLINQNLDAGRGQPSSEGYPIEFGTLKFIIDQMLKMLRHLKKKQVVHRDIKGLNILYLVDVEGRVSLIKLIDFGVALLKAPGAEADPFANRIVGTLGYMAPEQALRGADYQSDLYSFGVVIHQMMTGKLPLSFGSAKNKQEMVEQLRRVVKEDRVPLCEANPYLKSHSHFSALAEIMDRTIILDPSIRIDCEQLSVEIEGFWKNVPQEDLKRPILYSDS